MQLVAAVATHTYKMKHRCRSWRVYLARSLCAIIWTLGFNGLSARNSVSEATKYLTQINNSPELGYNQSQAPLDMVLANLELKTGVRVHGQVLDASQTSSLHLKILNNSTKSLSIKDKHNGNFRKIVEFNTLAMGATVLFHSNLVIRHKYLDLHRKRTTLSLCKNCVRPLSITSPQQYRAGNGGNYFVALEAGGGTEMGYSLNINGALFVKSGIQTMPSYIGGGNRTVSLPGKSSRVFLDSKQLDYTILLPSNKPIGHEVSVLSNFSQSTLAGKSLNVSINHRENFRVDGAVLKVDCAKVSNQSFLCVQYLKGGQRDANKDLSGIFKGVRFIGTTAKAGTMMLRSAATGTARVNTIPDVSGKLLSTANVMEIKGAVVGALTVARRLEFADASVKSRPYSDRNILLRGQLYPSVNGSYHMKFGPNPGSSSFTALLGHLMSTTNRTVHLPDTTGTILTTKNMHLVTSEMHGFEAISVSDGLEAKSHPDIRSGLDGTIDISSHMKVNGSVVFQGVPEAGSRKSKNTIRMRGKVTGRCAGPSVGVQFRIRPVYPFVVAHTSEAHNFVDGDVIRLLNVSGASEGVVKRAYRVTQSNSSGFGIDGLSSLPSLSGTVSCWPYILAKSKRAKGSVSLVLPIESNSPSSNQIVLPSNSKDSIIVTGSFDIAKYLNISLQNRVTSLKARKNVVVGKMHGGQSGGVTLKGSLLNGPCGANIAYVKQMSVVHGAVRVHTVTQHYFKQNDRVYIGPDNNNGYEERSNTFIVNAPGNGSFSLLSTAKQNLPITDVRDVGPQNATEKYVVRCRSALFFLNGTSLDIQNPVNGEKEIQFNDVSGKLITTGNMMDISLVGTLDGVHVTDDLVAERETTFGKLQNSRTQFLGKTKVQRSLSTGSPTLSVYTNSSGSASVVNIDSPSLQNGSGMYVRGRAGNAHNSTGARVVHIQSPGLSEGTVLDVKSSMLSSGSALKVMAQNAIARPIQSSIFHVQTSAKLGTTGGIVRVTSNATNGTSTRFVATNLTSGSVLSIKTDGGAEIRENKEIENGFDTVYFEVDNRTTLYFDESAKWYDIFEKNGDVPEVAEISWTANNDVALGVEHYRVISAFTKEEIERLTIHPPLSDRVWNAHISCKCVTGKLFRPRGVLLDVSGNQQKRGTIASLQGHNMTQGTVMRIGGGGAPRQRQTAPRKSDFSRGAEPSSNIPDTAR